MRFNTRNLMVGLVSVICMISSIFLAISSISGWGWFLFVGLLVLQYVEKENVVYSDEKRH